MALSLEESKNYFFCEVNKYSLYNRCENDYNIGGIKNLLFYDKDVYNAYTQDLNNRISSIAIAPETAFLRINVDFAKYTESFSRDNIGYLFSNILEIQVDKRLYDKRLFFEKIKNKTLIFIIQDNNDNYWLLGEESGFIISSMENTTGMLANEANGYTVIFQNFGTFQAKEILQSAIDNLVVISNCSQWAGIPMQPYNLETIRYCTLLLKQPDKLGN